MRTRRRSISIWFLSGLEMLLGVAGVVVGIFAIGFMLSYGQSDFFNTPPIFLIWSVIFVVASLALLVSGILTFMLKPLGRILSFSVLLLLTVGSVALLLIEERRTGSVGLCLAVALLFCLFLPGVKRQFQAGNDEISEEVSSPDTQAYDWAGFWIQFAFGALLGAGLGFLLWWMLTAESDLQGRRAIMSYIVPAAFRHALAPRGVKWAFVSGGGLILGFLAGHFRDRLWWVLTNK